MSIKRNYLKYLAFFVRIYEFFLENVYFQIFLFVLITYGFYMKAWL